MKVTQAKFKLKLDNKKNGRSSIDSAVVKTNNPDLHVVYDSSKSLDEGYYYRSKKNSEIRGLKKSRTMGGHWVDIDGLFKDLDSMEMDYNALKFCDPNLVEILYNEKGMEAVNIYLKQLQRGRHADKRQLPYRMAYDVNSILENDKLSFKQKRLMLQMVMKNKYVADVKMNFKFLKKGISLLMAMGLALASVPKATPIHAGEDLGKLYKNNEVVDCLDDSNVELQEVINVEQVTAVQGAVSDSKQKIVTQSTVSDAKQKKTFQSTVKEAEKNSKIDNKTRKNEQATSGENDRLTSDKTSRKGTV